MGRTDLATVRRPAGRCLSSSVMGASDTLLVSARRRPLAELVRLPPEKGHAQKMGVALH
jgi:hypothetical protein